MPAGRILSRAGEEARPRGGTVTHVCPHDSRFGLLARGRCPEGARIPVRAGLVAALVGSSLAWGALGCGRDQVEIISAIPNGEAGIDAGAATCSSNLADRLRVFDISVGKSIAWQKYGYDGFPFDERVALAVQPTGEGYIAWGEVNPKAATDPTAPSPLGVHVTPVDANFARAGADVILPDGLEVSGLVAHDNGFAVLVRVLDPGQAIAFGDTGDFPTIASLVRYKNGQQAWQAYLTGSLSQDAAETQTVYSPFLEGQLVWSDSTYGAYFVVRGGTTDGNPAFWRDALVFRDSFGQPAPLSVTHGCSNNGGVRLIPDPNKVNLSGTANQPEMTGLCVQQSRVAVKLTALENDQTVSDQEVHWSGYSGAKLGSLVKTADGYLVFWLSLGASNDHTGHDIRMARFDNSFNLVAGPTWLTRTPNVEEWNLHVVPYGNNQFLMIYGEIAITGPADDTDWAMYLGNYSGLRMKIIAADGTTLAQTENPIQGAPTTANAEPVVLPDGSVAWAFVNPTPDYSQVITGPNGPGQTTLHLARVCFAQ